MKCFKVCFFASIILLLLLFFVPQTFALSNSFVSIVNPIRGEDFWDLKNQKLFDVIVGQQEILKQFGMTASWLIRFDALQDTIVVKALQENSPNDDFGLFLEVTPSWANVAGITYRQSEVWHAAGSVLLSGYLPDERERLIDSAFTSFKEKFGFYPKSVGAWYIDSFSIDYMQKKYGVTSVLIVADQYTTDNYQVWGQYWGYPYYPSKNNTLIPAQSINNKIPVVVMQWAVRDPVNGYGKGVEESTYSVQANDYTDYHELQTNYFSKLIDVYTLQKFNQVNQVVVGLENTYEWNKYKEEYRKQIEVLSQKRQLDQLSLLTMKDFAQWYQRNFPVISPEQIIIADDPLGADKKTLWLMSPYYRIGWFYDAEGSAFRDIRQYTEGREEPCFSQSCSAINFATFPTRVLDDVTYGHRLILDLGKISDFQVDKSGENYLLSYKNEVGKLKQVEFLPRDVSINGKISTIDGLILEGVNSKIKDLKEGGQLLSGEKSAYQESFFGFIFKIVQFVLFIILAVFIPGFAVVRLIKQESLPLNIFLSLSLGMVNLTLVSFAAGYIRSSWLLILYVVAIAVIFIYKRAYKEIKIKNIASLNFTSVALLLLIIFGSVFQSLSLVRSGWVYDYGVGFWGPLGHDGIWHQALINQLAQQVPPVNPGLAGESLSNYHYFYDLLVAVTYNLSQIPVLDLLYRFYPVLFSLLLGVGTYILASRLFASKAASLFAVYFVYFAGSFGWIVEYLRERHFGGESAFWVNQPVSMNLNPPFAISLILLISIVLFFQVFARKMRFVAAVPLVIMSGSLIEFKAYAGIIVLGSLAVVALYQALFQKNYNYIKVFLGSFAIALIVFLPQNSGSSDLLVVAPFWFVHSMVDFTDRVGWLRLSQARQAYFARQEWLKYLSAESLGLVLFVVGNLGCRVIACFSIFSFLKKRNWSLPESMFIVLMVIISFLIPIIFIQKGNPWNTIQFAYYFLYFMAIFAGSGLVIVYRKLPRFFNLLILIIILLVTPINAVTTFKSGFYIKPPARVTISELDALSFLKTLPQGVVLTYPYNKLLREKVGEPYPLLAYETTSYVAAFSGKSSFVEDEIQQEILQNAYKKRIIGTNEFFNGRDLEWSRNFLEDNNIRYLYIPKIAGISFDWEKIGVKNIYENTEAIVLEVTK